jgi:hypothetical protein
MGIGASVFLLAIGAVLGFAVDDQVQGVDVSMIGYILMAAGLIGLFMTTLIFGRRDQVVSNGAATERVTTTRDVY